MDDLHPMDGLAEFAGQLGTAHDKDQRLALLKIVIAEALANVGERKFGFLLRNWPSLKDQFGRAYKLYLANFSWEKVRAEVDKEKIEFVKKLNSTISDIQTKLVAIPAAFLLIAAQLKNVGRFDISNLIVVIAALVFAALICFLIRNQLHALEAVNADILRLRDRLKAEGHLAGDISDRFCELEKLHHRHPRSCNGHGIAWPALMNSSLSNSEREGR